MIGAKLARRYEILGELGRGGMGIVYRARDPLLNREVAVKLVPRELVTLEAEGRFQREAQVIAQLDHPGIVAIYDIGRQDDGGLFFVMPVVEGQSLRLLLRAGSLSLADVLEIGAQTAEALAYSHARGVVHRDVKPENIMVARDGLASPGATRVRVMDFGLAVASTEVRFTKTGMVIGTLAYLSPEQAAGKAVDVRSDLYSLGTVLYECVAGEAPFSGEMQAVLYRIVHEAPQPPRLLGAAIREELEEILLSCLQKDPARRPARAEDLAQALRRHRAQLEAEEASRSVVITTGRVGRRAAAVSPFVGREKELSSLQRALSEALQGECQLALVSGEPGVGKSRLVEELRTLAQVRRIRVLQGRFVEEDPTFSYQGFCELIRDYFRSKDAGSSASARPDLSDLAADLVALFPVLAEIAELRSAASSGTSAPSHLAAEGPRTDRVRVFELLARTLARLSGGKPLVLVLENLHAASISIEALQYVVRRLGPTPTLVVGTYRSREVDRRHPVARLVDSFHEDPRFVALALAPLSRSEHGILVESVLPGGTISPALVERLFEAGEGNPFFTRELIRSMLDSGGLSKDDTGTWRLSEAAVSMEALPSTIQEAVGKRVERLPTELRELLSVASVLGRSFELRDLQVLVTATDADESIDRLISEGILEEDARGDRLSFASAIVRDVLYAALSRRRRRLLHGKYAEHLERRHAGKLERTYPQLVHHFTEAENAERTVHYGLPHVERLLAAFNAEDAIRVARTCLGYLADEEWAGERLEGQARMLLARAIHLSGSADEALRLAEEAIGCFERDGLPDGAVAAILFAADLAWQLRRGDDVRVLVERGLQLSRPTGRREPLLRLLSLATNVASLRGDQEKAAALQAESEALTQREAREDIPQGGRLVVAMAGPLPALEPAASRTIEEDELLATEFETLVRTDAHGELQPALASDWALSGDGRRLTLTLRPGVLFSDGTPLSANDVKASFERAFLPGREGIPAALTAIAGAAELRNGEATSLNGIRVVETDRVEIELHEPLPIFPALLTELSTAIVRHQSGEGTDRFLGTGPFRLVERAAEHLLLERNPRYWGPAPRLDSIELRPSLTASEIAASLRSGQVDVARDLLPQDLDDVLRDSSLRAGLVEAPRKNSYFVLFNSHSPVGWNLLLRRALTRTVSSQELVWGTLGRFAVPATGLIPPGILGHDSGRRRQRLAREKAREMIREEALESTVRLRAAVHPILMDRYRALVAGLLETWLDLGVEVTIARRSMAEYLEAEKDPTIDVIIGRWNADYDDPDNFTHGLFHSGNGLYRTFFSSPEADQLLEAARRETRSAVRVELYRKFEDLLLDSALLLPLFHDVDYRIAAPGVRGLKLGSSPPFVNYAEVGKAGTSPPRRLTGGTLRIPMSGRITTLDPAAENSVEQGEVLPCVFETLTRIVGPRILPCLATKVAAEAGGSRFRFQLRPGVRFHDGRTLTSRDVRYSFERLLLSKGSPCRYLLAPIAGARALIQGEARDLAGFRLESPTDFSIQLEKPLSFFPALLSHYATSIVPEAADPGEPPRPAVATGPFRVSGFTPGRELQLERNTDYWRDGFPRADGLVFRFDVTPEEIRREFLAGRFSLASDLSLHDLETFRRDQSLAPRYGEAPLLSTYFVLLDAHHGVLSDEGLRRRLFQVVTGAREGLVKRTLGRLAIPAPGLIPPGLLGCVSASTARHTDAPAPSNPVELATAIHPAFLSENAAFTEGLTHLLAEAGFVLRLLNDKTMEGYREARTGSRADVVLARWIADYPDPDTFLHGALHSREGLFAGLCQSPEIDRLAGQARAETDPVVRASLYQQAEDVLARDALVAPLFHPQVYRFARPDVEGLSVSFSTPIVAYEELHVRR